MARYMQCVSMVLLPLGFDTGVCMQTRYHGRFVSKSHKSHAENVFERETGAEADVVSDQPSKGQNFFQTGMLAGVPSHRTEQRSHPDRDGPVA